ncbi:glutathione S-transferase 1-1-like [Toxorhynchites rutilus septentrionalis]|uniref:glutathione S-transferase 1-1-like n=1 Tax=Toxorhynchites rutilus septentrionalis TaxID=329112 RepID=UPI00247AA04A|nr:glutathione S-transferase 1-1-like [Toxorhynchites rutilus septentrionalis]
MPVYIWTVDTIGRYSVRIKVKMTITLYYAPMSPPCRAIILLIKELELNIELKEVNVFAGETMTEDFLRMNPEHTIPLLDDNGFYLWESRAILTYLIDSFRPAHDLYPNIPKEKALINRVLYHELTEFYPNSFGLIIPIMKRQTAVVSDESKAKISNVFSRLELYLSRNDWFAGENITVADLSLLPTVASLVHCGFNISEFPRIADWYENCKVLKGYHDDQAVAQQLGGYFRSLVPEGL